MMSAVAPPLLRRASITMVLQFTLWEIMRMVSASGLYLGMGGHGGVSIISVGGDGGGVCGFGGLPGLSECLGLDRAS
jgi:hypothetical protein